MYRKIRNIERVRRGGIKEEKVERKWEDELIMNNTRQTFFPYVTSVTCQVFAIFKNILAL